MTSYEDDDETLTITTLSVTKFQGGKEKKMASMNKVDVALTAKLNGKKIDISGPTSFQMLGIDTGAWHFDFTLDDQTSKSVRFTTLDAMDGSKACPASGTGNQSRLIVGDHVEPNDPKQAHFTDNNNNKAKDGVVDVSFQWNFACNDPAITVGTYDPVVPNGGKT